MSDSILIALKNATRPFKPFKCSVGAEEFEFFSRRLSAAESAVINQVYNDAYNEALEELENENSHDFTAMRRTFEKQKKERLVDYIIDADKAEYLQEASSELDDLPWTDDNVRARAEQLENTAKGLLLNAPDSEIIDKALEKRAYVYAAVKGSSRRNVHIIYYSTYVEDESGEKQKAFDTPEDISDNLGVDVIEALFGALATALGEQKTDPLKLVEKKSSKGRTASGKQAAQE